MRMLLVLFAMAAVGSAHAVERFGVSRIDPTRRTYVLDGVTALTLANPIGLIEVHEVDGNELVIEATTRAETPAILIVEEVSSERIKLRVEYPTPASAKPGFLRSMFVKSVVSIGSVQINGSLISIGDDGVELKIGVPRARLGHLDVTTSSGDQTIEGRFAGERDQDRRVTLQTVSGTITCRGPCAARAVTIDASSGDVTLEATSAPAVRVQTSSGDQSLARITGDVEITASSGDVIITDGRGELSVRTTSGDITVRAQSDASRVRVQSSSGDLKLSHLAGALDVTSNSGEVTLGDFGGDPTTVQTSSGDITLTRGSGAVEVRSNSGEVSVYGHRRGPVDVRTSSGDVTFFDSAAEVDESARTISGDVRYSKRAPASASPKPKRPADGCDEALRRGTDRIIED